MLRRTLPVWLLSIAMTLPSLAAAQSLGGRGAVSAPADKGRFSIVLENDLFSFGPVTTDRFYTNGIFLHTEWSSPVVADLASELELGGFEASPDRGYIGFGLAHELHTPETLNPCGALFGDPLATGANPRGAPEQACRQAELTWKNDFAERDRPFAAVWSGFLAAQRAFHSLYDDGLLPQYRLWARADLGSFGPGAGKGYEVQKNWHGFFNDALLEEGSDPARTPVGWRISARGEGSALLWQLSAGSEVSLYRLVLGPVLDDADHWDRLGAEVALRTQVLVGAPRNLASAGLVLRALLLPRPFSDPVTPPGEYQSSHLYVEASADAAPVLTDMTYGDWSRYRHFRDNYSVGLHGKLMGLTLAADLTWQRILFEDPLAEFPSTRPIDDTYHRYGSVSLELTY